LVTQNLKYFALNKPFGILSQFTDKEGRRTLTDLLNVPKDVYSVGRLDKDSEGLLILTNNKKLVDHLLNPRNKHEREYIVQIEGIPSEEDLNNLRSGVVIEMKKTLPAKIKLINPPKLWDRNPPVRFRKNIPTSWLSVTLIEGRNRQVRKMTASIGFPALRLIRIRIKNINLGNLLPSEKRKLTNHEIMKLIK